MQSKEPEDIVLLAEQEGRPWEERSLPWAGRKERPFRAKGPRRSKGWKQGFSGPREADDRDRGTMLFLTGNREALLLMNLWYMNFHTKPKLSSRAQMPLTRHGVPGILPSSSVAGAPGYAQIVLRLY